MHITVRYRNATINRNTRKREPEIGPNGSCQNRQNPRVDGYGYVFGPPRSCGLGCWMVLEPNRTVYPVQTRTAGGLPGPVANTTCGRCSAANTAAAHYSSVQCLVPISPLEMLSTVTPSSPIQTPTPRKNAQTTSSLAS